MQSVDNLRETSSSSSRSFLKQKPHLNYFIRISLLSCLEKKGLTRVRVERKARIVEGWTQMVPLNRANTWKGRRGITPFEARISRERLPGPREPPFTTESAAIYGETADHFHALEKRLPRFETDIRFIRPIMSLWISWNYSFLHGEHVCLDFYSFSLSLSLVSIR